MRTCTKCGEEKDLALFPSMVKNGVLYHKHTCKKCRSERSTELIKANPERLEKKRAAGRERQKRLRIEDPERIKKAELKRRASEGHKQWEAEYRKKQARVNVDKWIIANEGAVCRVEPLHCFLCKNVSYVKTDNVVRKHGRRFCVSCSSKGVSNTGLKIERSIVDKKCITCDKEYKGRSGADSKCVECKAEANRASRRAYRARRTAKGVRPGNGLRTMARKAGAYMDTVIPKKVYERDKWKCVSCGCKVVMCKAYQPRQASIDHIIPLSMGGSHTYGNVQTMCVTCNSSKGNNITNNVQLTVFDVVRQ